MNKGFEDYWFSCYRHIVWPGECEEILGMPKLEDYGLSQQVFKEYVQKKYELGKRYSIDDEKLMIICSVISLCISIVIAIIIHLFIYILGQLFITILLVKLVEHIYKKKREKACAAMKIDAIERYLQDYKEWERKVDNASHEAHKTRGKELSDALWTKRYWEIIKEVMDNM